MFSRFIILCLIAGLVASVTANSSHANSNPIATTTTLPAGRTLFPHEFAICPVLQAFEYEHMNLSPEEIRAQRKDKMMTSYLLTHPNATLWDFFKTQVQTDHSDFKKLSFFQKVRHVTTRSWNYVTGTALALIDTVASVLSWAVGSIKDPKQGVDDIKEFFTEFSANIEFVAQMFRDDPRSAAENLGGGLLTHMKHHPEEFTAETILLVYAGSSVIHGLMHKVTAVFGSSSSKIALVLLSVLSFIHLIDDPIYIVAPIVREAISSVGEIRNGTKSAPDMNATLSFEPIQALDSCTIPVGFRPVFSTYDLCMSKPENIRMLFFGTKKHVYEMSREERVVAYERAHDIVCCYINDRTFMVEAPEIINGESTGRLTLQKVTVDCTPKP